MLSTIAPASLKEKDIKDTAGIPVCVDSTQELIYQFLQKQCNDFRTQDRKEEPVLCDMIGEDKFQELCRGTITKLSWGPNCTLQIDIKVKTDSLTDSTTHVRLERDDLCEIHKEINKENNLAERKKRVIEKKNHVELAKTRALAEEKKNEKLLAVEDERDNQPSEHKLIELLRDEVIHELQEEKVKKDLWPFFLSFQGLQALNAHLFNINTAKHIDKNVLTLLLSKHNFWLLRLNACKEKVCWEKIRDTKNLSVILTHGKKALMEGSISIGEALTFKSSRVLEKFLKYGKCALSSGAITARDYINREDSALLGYLRSPACLKALEEGDLTVRDAEDIPRHLCFLLSSAGLKALEEGELTVDMAKNMHWTLLEGLYPADPFFLHSTELPSPETKTVPAPSSPDALTVTTTPSSPNFFRIDTPRPLSPLPSVQVDYPLKTNLVGGSSWPNDIVVTSEVIEKLEREDSIKNAMLANI